MTILVENSSYHLRNMGDVAMLQVALRRLRGQWPDAELRVLTEAPELLAAHCPEAQPLDSQGRRLWFRSAYLAPSRRPVSKAAARRLRRIERLLRVKSPALLQWIGERRLRREGRKQEAAALRAYCEALFRCGMLVVTGGGNMTDAFAPHAALILDTLGTVIRRGAPTAMLGQGFGPISRPGLIARAREVLPKVGLIALREERSGRPLLEALGVSPEKITVTGDDAVELAFENRTEEAGDRLGVNVRVADYSGVGEAELERLRPVLREACARLETTALPVPISRFAADSDAESLHRLLGESTQDADAPDTPVQTVREIGRCRAIVTGSYHAGVFALSQGVPVVGIARTPYYLDKFLGLAQQFPGGCEAIEPYGAGGEEALVDAIGRAWEAAPRLRAVLVAAAREQVEQGRRAYGCFRDLCAEKSRR